MSKTHAEGDRRSRSRMIAFLIGPLFLALITLTTSRAAFFDTTDNTGNSLEAGSVTLTDDDAGAVLFNLTGMVPGDSESRCIVVSYSGTVTDPGPVTLYSGGFVDSDSLATELNLTVEEGTGGSFGDCTGFTGSTVETGTLAAFDTDHVDYSSGVGTWDPSSSSESRTYRITLELDADASNDAQGDSVTDLAFVWEITS